MTIVARSGRCCDCSYATSAPTRAEVVFAIQKHSAFTGHVDWDIRKVGGRWQTIATLPGIATRTSQIGTCWAGDPQSNE